jgi:hypothetical protein
MSSAFTDDNKMWGLWNENQMSPDIQQLVADAIAGLERDGEVSTYDTTGDHGQLIKHVSHRDLYPKVLYRMTQAGIELSPLQQHEVKRLVYQYSEEEDPGEDLDTLPLPFEAADPKKKRDKAEDEEEEEDDESYRGDSLLDDAVSLDDIVPSAHAKSQGMHPIEALIDYGYRAGEDGMVIDASGHEHHLPDLFLLMKQWEERNR